MEVMRVRGPSFPPMHTNQSVMGLRGLPES
jgi:hypothetical protein